MNKKLVVLGCTLFFGATMITSCGGDGDEESSGKSKKKVDIKKDSADLADPITVDNEKVDHRLPSPSLFFEVISEIGGKADLGLVNPVSNMESYTSESKKALNFGVYFSDLGYMFNYDSNAAMGEYFGVLEKLANELSISAVFSEEIMNKASENGENADSVYSYQTEVYNNAVNYLIDEKKQDVLAYMLIGGWIESMHIVSGLVGDYSENNQLIDQIAAQNEILESIMAHVEESIEMNPDLGDWYNTLYEIQEIYNQNLQSAEQSSEKNSSGKLVISGGQKVVLNAESFGTIVEKIEEIRSSIVTAE